MSADKEGFSVPVRAHTLRKDIVETLTDAILAGKLKPGERLNESKLARHLQVSRAPIREALQNLQLMGLALAKPRQGMFVVDLDDEDIRKINSIRVLLEGAALRLCRARLDPSGEKRLSRLVKRLENAEELPRPQRVRLDLEFHRAIWNLTGNEHLERALASLATPVFAHAVIRFTSDKRLQHIMYSHRPILEFLQGKSQASAEEVMREHLAVGWDWSERLSGLGPSEPALAPDRT